VIVLVSTYDLGRQPFGLASPAAWLRHAGLDVVTRDLSRDRDEVADDELRAASMVAFYLPMHTATRLALPVIERTRRVNPNVRIAAYGLYAPLSEAALRESGVDVILGPEAEGDLLALAQSLHPVPGRHPVPDTRYPSAIASLPRLKFLVPDRRGLPPLTRYAALEMPDGQRLRVGATDATRGCKHRCRHCPIVPVYDGQFRVVPVDVVLADVDHQVAAGAQHITFADPDFFNGPTHAQRIVDALHARHPSITYDVTIKVEHLLQHRDLLPLLARTGCLFITSAVESIDDRVLALLEKGHTRRDFITAVGVCRDAGVLLCPTFVAFTPWTTIDGYRELLDAVASLELVTHVAPVQWGLRLLVTSGSRLVELEDVSRRLQPFDARTLTYPWRHDDPQVDALQAAIMRTVATAQGRPRDLIFRQILELAGSSRHPEPMISRTAIPYLDEPWYC
jgi:radical SAM superfamily enzyme YgiQ (UPF0313 family)